MLTGLCGKWFLGGQSPGFVRTYQPFEPRCEGTEWDLHSVPRRSFVRGNRDIFSDRRYEDHRGRGYKRFDAEHERASVPLCLCASGASVAVRYHETRHKRGVSMQVTNKMLTHSESGPSQSGAVQEDGCRHGRQKQTGKNLTPHPVASR